MSDQSKKVWQDVRPSSPVQVGGWALPVAAAGILVTGSLVAWLRSRRTQPAIDAQTTRRLSRPSGPAVQSTPFASDIVTGERAVARPPVSGAAKRQPADLRPGGVHARAANSPGKRAGEGIRS